MPGPASYGLTSSRSDDDFRASDAHQFSGGWPFRPAQVRGGTLPVLRTCRHWLRGLVVSRHGTRGPRLWARPAATHLAGTGTDPARTGSQRRAEDARLRQQRLVRQRRVKRPGLTPPARALVVLLAGRARAWRQALLLVRPETLRRRHRAGLRSCWRRQSRPGPGRPPLPAQTVALIRQLAAENPRWGVERLHGDRGKLGLRVAKRTIQTSSRDPGAQRPRGQAWATCLRHHAHETGAGDCLPVTELLVRPLCACCLVERGPRRVVHVGVTRHPTAAWVAPQRRAATPCDRRPRYLLRDNDGTFRATCARVAAVSGIQVRCTPSRAPRAQALGERCLGRVRRACLEQVPALGARQRSRVLRQYVACFNRARPHQGLDQALPAPSPGAQGRPTGQSGAVPALGGLHHAYQRAA